MLLKPKILKTKLSALLDSTKRLIKNEFYQNILSLFSGMLIARLFPTLFALVIARIYSPDEFGNFVLYLTIASVLSIFSTAKLENAIVLAETDEERKNVFTLAQKVNVLVNLAVAAGLLAYITASGESGASFVKMLLLIPVYSFSFASVQILRSVFIARKNFRRLSVLEVSRAVITGVLQCLFFVFPETGLFLGAALSQLLIYLWFSRNVFNSASVLSFGFSAGEKSTFKRYIDFPKFSVASEVLNYVSSQLPVFLIKPFFGQTMLGLYSFQHRYISTPVQLLSSSIAQVYIREARSLKSNTGKLGELTFSLFRKQFLAGVLPFAILGFWGEPIFVFIFGSEWQFSGFLAQLVSPWLFAVMLVSPLSSVLVVMEKQRVSMWYNIFLLIARFAGLIAGGLILNDVVLTVAIYSATGFLFFTGLGIYSFHLSGVHLVKAGWFMLKVLAFVLIPLIILKLWL